MIAIYALIVKAVLGQLYELSSTEWFYFEPSWTKIYFVLYENYWPTCI